MAHMQMCKPAFETTRFGSESTFSNSSWDSYSTEYNHSNLGYSMNQHLMGQMHNFPSRKHVSGNAWTGEVSEHISNATSINHSRMPAYYRSAHGAAGGYAFEWSEKQAEKATYLAIKKHGHEKFSRHGRHFNDNDSCSDSDSDSNDESCRKACALCLIHC
ncbi:hypothetical protein Ancab_032805 [Ancistrocladus abbreviatus]